MVLGTSFSDQTLQMSISNDGDVTTLLNSIYSCLCWLLQSKKHVCTKMCTNHLSPAPAGHSFHHILLKCKKKSRQFLNLSSCRAAFSKICTLVSFILMLKVYIKIMNNKHFLCQWCLWKGRGQFRQGQISSRFPSPRRWIQWIRNHCLEAQLH